MVVLDDADLDLAAKGCRFLFIGELRPGLLCRARLCGRERRGRILKIK